MIFSSLFKSKIQPIGLDIGHSMIKMIQLSRKDQSVRVVAAEEEKLDPDISFGTDEWNQQVAELLQKMYNRGQFNGRSVVVSLPGDYLKIKSLRLDTESQEEIDEMIRTEVASRFGLNPDRDEIRYMVAGNVYQGEQIKNEVIFFGVEREKLSQHIDLIESSGLIPISLDTVPCALFRSFQSTLRRREDKDIVSVVVDLGACYTTVIIGKGQEIVFIKQIPIAGNAFNEQVAQRLGITVNEAIQIRTRLREDDDVIDDETRRAVLDAMSSTIENLAHEISLCFRYYAVTFRGRRPDEAAFAGGEAYESALMDAIRRHLGVEVRITEPLRGYDLGHAHFNCNGNSHKCEWAVAVGLALKGMEMNVVRKQHEEEAVVS